MYHSIIRSNIIRNESSKIFATVRKILIVPCISGSHYIYEKDGRIYPIPYHGSKEMGEGLRKKIMKDLGLK